VDEGLRGSDRGGEAACLLDATRVTQQQDAG
jgi:hypothetical protein